MKRKIILPLMACIVMAMWFTLPAVATERVRTGLDVLIQQNYQPLLGKRIGLVTNHSGITADGRRILDVLLANKNITVTTLFCPEHGINGQYDQQVKHCRDSVNHLPIYSLYGKTKKPTAAMLQNVDVLVFDIQDLGTRFYTYISTLAYVMQAAKEHHKKLIILDRPNPLGGEIVEGPLPDRTLLGKFTSYFTIPVRYGMTIGELARLYNRYYPMNCQLQIIPLQGWRRQMYFDETNLVWVNPSPNIRSLTAAMNYPGLGVLEATNLSVGRGTNKPFIFYGAPWIDSEVLVKNLNARKLAGVQFVAIHFKPQRIKNMPKYPYTNQQCYGFMPLITNKQLYRPVDVVVHVMDVLYQLYPQRFKFAKSMELLGQHAVKTEIKAGVKPAEIIASWNIARFLLERQKVLLY